VVFTLTPVLSLSPSWYPQDLHVYKPVSLMQEDGCVCSQGRWPWCFAMHMAHRLPLQQGVRTDEAALEQSVVPFAFELYCLAAWMASLLHMLNVKGWILNKNMLRSLTLWTTFKSFPIGEVILMHTNLNVQSWLLHLISLSVLLQMGEWDFIKYTVCSWINIRFEGQVYSSCQD